MMTILEKYKQLNLEIEKIAGRCGRNKDEIKVIAVTKYVDTVTTKEALDAGLEHIGENRVEGGVEKWEQLGERGNWHFIGSLQTKKVKKVIDKYDYFHSLDRLSLAEELDKRSSKKVSCFVQVNVSQEESKSGISEAELIPFIEKLAEYPSIEVVGLMTMAPFYQDPERTRPIFRKLRELRDQVEGLGYQHAPCKELSMGMSNDYSIAIEEGATFIRIGTVLVGNPLKN
ncbi:YggS family pyridoxal phosphate-dependent enzyme [Alkalihalobacillus trypoxylicola]